MPEVYSTLHKTSAKKDETAVDIQGEKKRQPTRKCPWKDPDVELGKKGINSAIKNTIQ